MSAGTRRPATAPRVQQAPASREGAELRTRGDLVTVGAALVLLGAALAVGAVLSARGVPLFANAAPFYAHLETHVSWGSLAVLPLAVVVVGWGPALAVRLPWRRLLFSSYVAALGWSVGLALSRGWSNGVVAPRLTRETDYLTEVPTAPPLTELLTGFADRIPGAPPDNWVTHVAGHPPGALLTFVGLDRAGLGGPTWAALLCLAGAAAAVPAIAVAARELCGPSGEPFVRSAVPFLVLFPGAVWIATAADALFLGVTASALALFVLATGRRGLRHDVLAAAAGLLLGWSLYLSYGFVLLCLPVLAVAVLRRRVRTLLAAGIAVIGVVLLVTAGGFWWWDGYEALVGRYYAGWGGDRPYAYWVWANLAVTVAVVGPATCAGLRRTLYRPDRSGVPRGVVVLVGCMAAVILAATLTGMSKAETERIWLPFTAWLALAGAALPPRGHRLWLAAQAANAFALQHILYLP